MNTSATSTFEEKVEILSVVAEVKDATVWAGKFCELWDMSIPIAVAMQSGWIGELTDRGVEEMERCFTALCNLFDMTPVDLISHLAPLALDVVDDQKENKQ